jgi:hypothetical protein
MGFWFWVDDRIRALGWLLGEIGMLPSGGMKMANAMKAKSMDFCMLPTIRNILQSAHVTWDGKQFMTRLSERA